MARAHPPPPPEAEIHSLKSTRHLLIRSTRPAQPAGAAARRAQARPMVQARPSSPGSASAGMRCYLAEAAGGTGPRQRSRLAFSFRQEARIFCPRSGNRTGALAPGFRGVLARSHGARQPGAGLRATRGIATRRASRSVASSRSTAPACALTMPTVSYSRTRRTLFSHPARHLCNLQGTHRGGAARIDARRESNSAGTHRPISGARFSTSIVESAEREIPEASEACPPRRRFRNRRALPPRVIG